MKAASTYTLMLAVLLAAACSSDSTAPLPTVPPSEHAPAWRLTLEASRSDVTCRGSAKLTVVSGSGTSAVIFRGTIQGACGVPASTRDSHTDFSERINLSMGMPGDSVQFRGATCAYSGTVGAGRGSMSGPVTCADTYSKRSYTVHGYWSAAIEP